MDEKLTGMNGAQYLADKLIEMDAQIRALREDLGTVLAIVEALGKANKYELIKTSTDEGESLHWKSAKGRIFIP
jgi:hypothetical protein